MLSVEADAIYTRLMDLWPDWKPADELAAFWVKQIKRYPDDSIVRQAVEAHRVDSVRRGPTMKGLATQVAILTPSKPHDDEDDNRGISGTYIQCTEHKTPSKVGWFVPLCYAKDDRVPPPHIVKTHAEGMRKAYARSYGGEWRVVVGTEAEMVNARDAMRSRQMTESKGDPCGKESTDG